MVQAASDIQENKDAKFGEDYLVDPGKQASYQVLDYLVNRIILKYEKTRSSS